MREERGMGLRAFAVDLAIAAGVTVLIVLVVEFTLGPGMQFVYFAF